VAGNANVSSGGELHHPLTGSSARLLLRTSGPGGTIRAVVEWSLSCRRNDRLQNPEQWLPGTVWCYFSRESGGYERRSRFALAVLATSNLKLIPLEVLAACRRRGGCELFCCRWIRDQPRVSVRIYCGRCRHRRATLLKVDNTHAPPAGAFDEKPDGDGVAQSAAVQLGRATVGPHIYDASRFPSRPMLRPG
jgi:hypothetical protein